MKPDRDVVSAAMAIAAIGWRFKECEWLEVGGKLISGFELGGSH